MDSLNNVSPLIIPVLALLIPIVSIIAWTILRVTRLNLLHETIRHLSQHGQPIPAELLNQLADSKSTQNV